MVYVFRMRKTTPQAKTVTLRMSSVHRRRLDTIIQAIVPRPNYRSMIEAMIDAEYERQLNRTTQSQEAGT